jgi:hypothetical protein
MKLLLGVVSCTCLPITIKAAISLLRRRLRVNVSGVTTYGEYASPSREPLPHFRLKRQKSKNKKPLPFPRQIDHWRYEIK